MRITAPRRMAAAAIRRMRGNKQLHQPPELPVQPGLPDGLPADVLAREVTRETGSQPTEVHHQHLSGWKHAGAYRLLIETAAGPYSLIFKDARYSADHLAALEGLPVRPGPPEIAVYATGSPRLKAWIPQAHWWQVRVPGERYHYLLEDLDSGYTTPDTDDALVALCSKLPVLHDDLRSALGRSRDLLIYDDTFGKRLLEYAHDALEQYEQQRSSPAVQRLLRRWDSLERQYSSALDDALGRHSLRPVHADLNLANVLSSRDDSGDIRLLDWEWAGMGIPHLDLAALLKGASPKLERRALAAYETATAAESHAELWRTYQWCKLQRGLLDASFLSRQSIEIKHSGRLDLDRYVHSSAERATLALDELGKGRSGPRYA